jgi:uncharacterized membrane protein
MIDWGVVARAIHVVVVVAWIGGVWLVTTVLLPAMRRKPQQEWIRELDAIERHFAPQARIAVLLVLLSGLYMLDEYDLWDRFRNGRYWWMHLMVGVWLVFAALLFVIEPLIIRRTVRGHTAESPPAMFARMQWMHGVMLVLSMIAVFAAVAGSHGLF